MSILLKVSILAIYLFCFLSCNSLLDGEDRSKDEDICPSLSEEDFFPFSEGKKWIYDYSEVNEVIPSSTENKVVGTLTLLVTKVSECHEQEINVTLEEEINGEWMQWRHTDEEEHLGWQVREKVQKNRSLSFVIGKQVSMDSYTLEPIKMADFKIKESRKTVSQEVGDSYAGTTISLGFERGEGLTSWSRREVFHRDTFTKRLTLKSE